MSSTYADVVTGLIERLSTIDGLAVDGGVPAVFNGLPIGGGIPITPCIRLEYAGGSLAASGNAPTTLPRGIKLDKVQAIVFVEVQADGSHEDTLIPFIDAVPAALAAPGKDASGHPYPRLGGRVEDTRITDIRSSNGVDGYLPLSGVLYRIVTFALDIYRR